MKYRLKKDLPFAKAGTEITLHRDNLYYPYFNLERKNDGSLHLWCQDWHTYDSWIEEVKPREWWLVITNLEFETAGFSSEELAIEYANQHCNNSKIIRVREVL